MSRSILRLTLCVTLGLPLLGGSFSRTVLAGKLPLWGRFTNDVECPVDFSATRTVSVMLKHSADKQSALGQLGAEQQRPGSPQYHKWITPEQAAAYGPDTHSPVYQSGNTGATLGARNQRVAIVGAEGADQSDTELGWQPERQCPRYSRCCVVCFEWSMDHAYSICFSDPAASANNAACTIHFANSGGTSASTPLMAGTQLLIDQATASLWGNPDSIYYARAQSQYASGSNSNCDASLGNGIDSGCVFHDITTGNTDMPCATGSLNCYAPSGSYWPVLC